LFLIACLCAPLPTSAGSLTEEGPVSVQGPSPGRPPLIEPGSLGFWLVGIVVADDPAITFAIVEHEKASGQRVCRQGERVNGVLIKRILRDVVIVDAGEGDRRLPLQQGPAAHGPPMAQAPEPRLRVQKDAARDRRISGRYRIVTLDRHDVAVALSDVNRVLAQVDLSPVTRFDQPAGFRITGIPPASILSRMGLRDGDIIKGIDDWEITHPEQAAEFLRRVRGGGELTVTVNKRRRTRHLVLQIQ
jgi:general secretion pathway protein C